jgi:hypothetical protein
MAQVKLELKLTPEQLPQVIELLEEELSTDKYSDEARDFLNELLTKLREGDYEIFDVEV